VFAAGQGLHGDLTNRIYYGTNAFVTTDDVTVPFQKVRAKYIKIVPGQYIEARHATLYLGTVPVFYLPYYSRNLGERANNFSFIPGYRSSFGPFLRSSYTWLLNEQLDGTLHADYRLKRGVGAGPDLNYHLGRWGDGTFKYYYLHDDDPGTNTAGAEIPENRQRVFFSYQSTPFSNLNVKGLVQYQSDARVLRDFFEGEYRQNPQPDTFFEANKFWQNFSLDVLARPRVNDFLETVERLPDVKLTGFRQQLGATPLYYESESSAGYYRRRFAETNGFAATNYAAWRADSYHQVLLPRTFFGWLNVTPRVGGRFTYYGEATGPGASTDEHYRGVFNTGTEVSFKASRVWPAVRSRFFDVDGVRHIVEPSVNYVFVPEPSCRPNDLPQFDTELPSLRLLPIEYPDYNAIDSVDSQNVIRFGLRNKLQTKRQEGIEDLVNWEVFTDWRLRPRTGQTTFADIYSDLAVKPRSWLTFESETRFDVSRGEFRLAHHSLSLQPNDVWSWSLGHYYLRDDLATAAGLGNNLIASRIFYRLNENWGVRMGHHFEARDGVMEEQYYTLYRDFRSWTSALTFRVRDNRVGSDDYAVVFTFSIKAAPKYGLGEDTARPYSLLGM
jgi:lipopolysaccharide assembly outer membrane protein LptD (OstA)